MNLKESEGLEGRKNDAIFPKDKNNLNKKKEKKEIKGLSNIASLRPT